MGRAHRRGRAGEEAAARYLVGQGWTVLDRNWRFHHKELDLVVERDGLVAFVEVKTRTAGGLAHPLEALTAAKRRELTIAARGWVAARGRPYHAFRFDVVTVRIDGPRLHVEHLPDAWRG